MIDITRSPSREDIKRTIKYLKYTKINEYLSEAMAGISDAMEPDQRLFDNLGKLMHGVAQEIEAEFAVVLRPQLHEPARFIVAAQYTEMQPRQAPPYYDFTEADWDALGDKRGFKIYSDADTSRLRGTNLEALLPPFEGDLETAIIGVGTFEQPVKFVLIFAHQLNHLGRDDHYRDDLQDLFALLTLWLHQIYNLTLHRIRERRYDNDRSQFIQDVMHQLTGSLSAITAGVERMISGRETDYSSALQRLYQRAHIFQRYTQTFSLAAEKRAITEVYTEEFKQFQPDDWVPLIQRNCDFFLDKAKHYRIDGPRVVVDSFKDLPDVRIKPHLMDLAIFNLVDNAVKYSVRYADSPVLIEASMTPDNSTVLIHFVNHGIRIRESDAKTIFERYQRSFDARDSEPNGTGVGLYLCRQIMRLHGGDIEVTPSVPSALFPGAHKVRFTVRVPVMAQVTQPVITPATETDERPTLLVVEDEAWLHQNLIMTLQENFHVEVAHNSEQAITFLAKPRQRERVKAILLDIQLTNPGSNAPSGRDAGIELARMLTQDHGYNIPIIGITAYSSARINHAMLAAGAKTVLRRSIALDELVQTIDRYMQR